MPLHSVQTDTAAAEDGTLLPILTLAALTTAPTPVITPHPSSAALSSGKSGGIFNTAASGMVDSCAKVETPAKCRIGVLLTSGWCRLASGR